MQSPALRSDTTSCDAVRRAAFGWGHTLEQIAVEWNVALGLNWHRFNAWQDRCMSVRRMFDAGSKCRFFGVCKWCRSYKTYLRDSSFAYICLASQSCLYLHALSGSRFPVETSVMVKKTMRSRARGYWRTSLCQCILSCRRALSEEGL